MTTPGNWNSTTTQAYFLTDYSIWPQVDLTISVTYTGRLENNATLLLMSEIYFFLLMSVSGRDAYIGRYTGCL